MAPGVVKAAAAVLAASAAAVAVSGCGDQAAPRDDAGGPTSILLTSASIARQVDRVAAKGPAETVLSFWRDVQYANLPAAYLRLSPQLRAEVDYGRFASAYNVAQQYFLTLPRVQSVESNGPYTTVYLLLQPGPRPTAKDQPFAFNVVRGRNGAWTIATDPRNVLGIAPAGTRVVAQATNAG